ncbi:MAG: MarR family transcriptional regulator [Euryarchaeota archaeon]|nr:MarR family transcriptional regulator [Euryarchaeota archaeon]
MRVDSIAWAILVLTGGATTALGLAPAAEVGADGAGAVPPGEADDGDPLGALRPGPADATLETPTTPHRNLLDPVTVTVVGGGALAVIAGLGWLAWKFLHAPVARLFTRLERPRLLEQRVRGQIHDVVRDDPGVHASQIQSRLGLAQGQLQHHLGVLERERLLVRVPVQGAHHYFLSGTVSPAEMRAMAAARHGNLDRVLAEIRENPGIPVAELAARLGLSPPRVSRLSQRLEDLGLVERVRTGRQVLLRPGAGRRPPPRRPAG